MSTFKFRCVFAAEDRGGGVMDGIVCGVPELRRPDLKSGARMNMR